MAPWAAGGGGGGGGGAYWAMAAVANNEATASASRREDVVMGLSLIILSGEKARTGGTAGLRRIQITSGAINPSGMAGPAGPPARAPDALAFAFGLAVRSAR